MALKSYKQKSSIYVLSKFGAACLNLLSIALFTRVLETDDYGSYLLFSSYVTLVCAILFWWHRLSAYRYYHKYENEYDSFIRTSIYLFWSLILMILMICGVIFFTSIDQSVKSLIYLCTIGAIIKSNYDLNQSLFNIARCDIIFGINVVIRSLIFIVFGLIFIFHIEKNHSSLIYAFMGSFILILIYSNFIILRGTAKGEFSWGITNKFISYGFPMIGLFIFDYILSFSDRLFIDHYKDSSMVGIYGANYDLIKQILLFLMIIQSYILYPKINKAYEKSDESTVNKILAFNLNIFITIFMPLGIMIIYFNQFISTIFLGEDFIQYSNDLIPLFSVMFLIWGVKIYHFDYFFQLKEKTKYPMYILFGGSVINIVLNIYLIQKWGIIGAAYSTVIAYLFVFVLSAIMARRLMESRFNFEILIKTLMIILISISIIKIPQISDLGTIFHIIIFVCIYSILTIRYNFKELKPYLNNIYN